MGWFKPRVKQVDAMQYVTGNEGAVISWINNRVGFSLSQVINGTYGTGGAGTPATIGHMITRKFTVDCGSSTYALDSTDWIVFSGKKCDVFTDKGFQAEYMPAKEK